ncbi:MAG: hypothetical protein WD491_09995 [Balneolales bacterium]
MKTTDVNSKLIDSYIALLKNMSSQNKLDLISKLSQTVKKDIHEASPDFYQAFGGWDENESAEDLILNIKSTRTFNRKIEEF